jgi:hypothetical protein
MEETPPTEEKPQPTTSEEKPEPSSPETDTEEKVEEEAVASELPATQPYYDSDGYETPDDPGYGTQSPLKESSPLTQYSSDSADEA